MRNKNQLKFLIVLLSIFLSGAGYAGKKHKKYIPVFCAAAIGPDFENADVNPDEPYGDWDAPDYLKMGAGCAVMANCNNRDCQVGEFFTEFGREQYLIKNWEYTRAISCPLCSRSCGNNIQSWYFNRDSFKLTGRKKANENDSNSTTKVERPWIRIKEGHFYVLRIEDLGKAEWKTVSIDYCPHEEDLPIEDEDDL